MANIFQLLKSGRCGRKQRPRSIRLPAPQVGPDTVFVKQYGCKRSGTCYVTALLQLNFKNVHVLIHKLGGKHAAPIDYQSWTAGPPELQQAIAANQIRAAIAVKDPYAWLYSYVRAHRTWNPRWRQAYDQDPAPEIRRLCERWNYCHDAWLNAPAAFVFPFRHDELLRDFAGTMAQAQQQLALTPRYSLFGNIRNKMSPNDQLTRRRFDSKFYLDRQYLAQLGPKLVAVITDSIDWDLAQRLNYRPESSPVS